MSEYGAALLGLGCAAPARRVSQAQTLELAMELSPPESEERRRQTEAIYRKSGVGSRGVARAQTNGGVSETLDTAALFRAASVVAPYGPTTAERMAEYAAQAAPLAERSARAALEDAGVSAKAITHLVTASCTGFSAPGWDLALIERMGLSPGVLRTHVGFMGCHAAINALRVAQAFALADPRARALVCCTEICSIHFRYEARPDQVVANALFADGSASVVIAQSEGGFARLGASSSRVLADSADQMRWDVGDHGFEMFLGAELPETVRREAAPWLHEWLDGAAVGITGVRSWAVHPGGPRILSAVADGAGLGADAMSDSRAVLAEHGNMSSATVLFILDAMRRAARGMALPAALVSFGPGVAAEGMLLV